MFTNFLQSYNFYFTGIPKICKIFFHRHTFFAFAGICGIIKQARIPARFCGGRQPLRQQEWMCNVFDIESVGVLSTAELHSGATLLFRLRRNTHDAHSIAQKGRRPFRGVAPYWASAKCGDADAHTISMSNTLHIPQRLMRWKKIPLGKAYVMALPCSETHRLLLTEKMLLTIWYPGFAALTLLHTGNP